MPTAEGYTPGTIFPDISEDHFQDVAGIMRRYAEDGDPFTDKDITNHLKRNYVALPKDSYDKVILLKEIRSEVVNQIVNKGGLAEWQVEITKDARNRPLTTYTLYVIKDESGYIPAETLQSLLICHPSRELHHLKSMTKNLVPIVKNLLSKNDALQTTYLHLLDKQSSVEITFIRVLYLLPYISRGLNARKLNPPLGNCGH